MRQPDFAKVFVSILDSTIASNYRVRHLFMDMLLLADWEGEINLTHEALARRTGWVHGLEALHEDLSILAAPDADSQTPDEEGRRIVPLDPKRSWGWRVVNIEAYRSMGGIEQMREKTRKRVQKHRLRAVAPPADEWAVQIVRSVLGQIAPRMREPEDAYIGVWLRQAGNDPWKLCAALCEVELATRKARSPMYISRVVNERERARWQDISTGALAEEYVRHRMTRTPEGEPREWLAAV